MIIKKMNGHGLDYSSDNYTKTVFFDKEFENFIEEFFGEVSIIAFVRRLRTAKIETVRPAKLLHIST